LVGIGDTERVIDKEGYRPNVGIVKEYLELRMSATLKSNR